MNPFKKYETDPKLEKDGVPIEFDGMTFYCRRAGGANRAYRAAAAVALLEPGVREKINSEDETEQLEAQNQVELYAFIEAVLFDWKDVQGRDDKPLTYSKENARDLMISCSEVWNYVRVMSQSRDSFRREQVQELGADLGNSSDGTASTAQT